VPTSRCRQSRTRPSCFNKNHARQFIDQMYRRRGQINAAHDGQNFASPTSSNSRTSPTAKKVCGNQLTQTLRCPATTGSVLDRAFLVASYKLPKDGNRRDQPRHRPANRAVARAQPNRRLRPRRAHSLVTLKKPRRCTTPPRRFPVDPPPRRDGRRKANLPVER